MSAPAVAVADDGIAVLARGLFWPSEAGVLVIWGYYDESGEYGPDGGLVNMTVAGCFSTLERWRKFESQWKAALDDEGLYHFHMTDFEAWKPPFDFRLPNGRRDQEKHNRLLNALIDIMLGHIDAFYGFGAGSPIPTALKKQHRMSMEDCIAGAIGGAVNEAWEKYRRPLNLVFAKQDHLPVSEIRKFIQLYDYAGRDRIKTDTYAFASDVRPLQAADILAYEVARAQRCARPERYPFQRLREGAAKRGVDFKVAWKVRSTSDVLCSP